VSWKSTGNLLGWICGHNVVFSHICLLIDFDALKMLDAVRNGVWFV